LTAFTVAEHNLLRGITQCYLLPLSAGELAYLNLGRQVSTQFTCPVGMKG